MIDTPAALQTDDGDKARAALLAAARHAVDCYERFTYRKPNSGEELHLAMRALDKTLIKQGVI